MVVVSGHLVLDWFVMQQQINDTMSTFGCDLYSSQNLIRGHIWLQPRHWVFWENQSMSILLEMRTFLIFQTCLETWN